MWAVVVGCLHVDTVVTKLGAFSRGSCLTLAVGGRLREIKEGFEGQRGGLNGRRPGASKAFLATTVV
jgi:hypothetical protein